MSEKVAEPIWKRNKMTTELTINYWPTTSENWIITNGQNEEVFKVEWYDEWDTTEEKDWRPILCQSCKSKHLTKHMFPLTVKDASSGIPMCITYFCIDCTRNRKQVETFIQSYINYIKEM